VERALLQERSAAADSGLRRTTTGSAILSLSALLVMIVAVWFVNRELGLRARAERALAEHRRLLQSVMDDISDAVIVTDENGTLILRNPVAVRLHGGAPANTPPEDRAKAFGLYRPDGVTLIPLEELPTIRAARGESIDGEEMYVRNPGQQEGRWQLVAGRQMKDEHGRSCGGVLVLRDITERKNAEGERTRLILELTEALSHVKMLSGLLPICASCKKIRDDRGYWNQIESYIRQHSEAEFTHGICPDCLARLYPEVLIRPSA